MFKYIINKHFRQRLLKVCNPLYFTFIIINKMAVVYNENLLQDQEVTLRGADYLVPIFKILSVEDKAVL